MDFGIIKKLLTATLLLFFLGATALRQALNLATQKTISWFSVLPVAIIGGLQQGFVDTHTMIFNAKTFFVNGLGGNLIFGLFKISALWLFIFMLIYMIWDTATGDAYHPTLETAILSIVVVIIGALLFGSHGNSILLTNTVNMVTQNASNIPNTTSIINL